MPQLLRCPQGHQWELQEEGRPAICPICGSADASQQTLSLDAAPSGGAAAPAPDTRTPSLTETLNPSSGAPPQQASVASAVTETLAASEPAPPGQDSATPAFAETLAASEPASPERGSATPALVESLEASKLIPATPRYPARGNAGGRAPADLTLPGYRLLGELGRGGMGVVYKAEQVGLNRLVALKMILSGEYAAETDLVRFRHEAEAVAKLQHPNIVQVYEINEWDGKPYFCMEFVDGGPLGKRLGGNPQPFRQAAGLVQQLAGAMDYAHQRGIVHRDLKPANVLLTADGPPKITDFGLAKRLDDADGPTRSGAVLGTPSYMAPEQAEGRTKEVGPAGDIYSLGVILYETLVGRPPFKGSSVWDTLDQVRTQEPVPPSRLDSKVPRDLETVCLKCLHKDPHKRYASAGALAEDLRRFVAGEPILARPTPAWERAWKWARRRPLAAALAAVSALFVLSLMTGGLAFGAYQRGQAQKEATLRRVAEKEHERAEQNFQHAEQNFQRARLAVDEMLTRVGQERLAHEPRMEQVRRDLLAKALDFYQRFLDEKSTDPQVRWETGRAYLRVADIRHMLGEDDAAEQEYAKAQSLFTDLLKEQGGRTKDEGAALLGSSLERDLAVCRDNLGRLLNDAGRTPEAEQTFRAAWTLRKGLVEETGQQEDRLELAAIANNLGILLLGGGRFTEAEPVLRQALQLREQLAGGSAGPVYRRDLARSHNNLGLLLAATGRLDDAEQAFRQALKILKPLAAQGPDVPDYRQELAVSYNHVGNLWRDTDPKRSEEAYQESLRLREQLVADFPTVPIYRQEQAASYHSLGFVRQAAGRQEAAEQAYGQALAIEEKLVADYPKVPDYRYELAGSYNNRGILLQTNNRLTEAEKVYRQALSLLEKLVADHPTVPGYQQELAGTLQNLAVLFQTSNRPDEADKNSRRAVELRRQLAERHPRAPVYQQAMASAQINLGALWQMNGKLSEAEQCYRQAVDLFTKLAGQYPMVPDYRHLLATGCNNLGNLLRATNHPQEAEQVWRKAVELLAGLQNEQPSVPIYRQEMARSYNELGIFLVSTGRGAEAEQAWGHALALQEQLAADFPRAPVYRQELAKYHGNLGILHAQANRLDQAEQSYRRAIALLEELEKASPDVPVYWQELTVPYMNLARLLAAVGARSREVEECWRRLVALKERLVDAYPKVPGLQSDLGLALDSLAGSLLRRDKVAEARQCLQEAVRRQRAALDLNPQDAGYRQHLCSHYLALAQTHCDLNDPGEAAATVAELLQVVPAGWSDQHVAAALLARCAGLASKDEKLPAAKRDELARTHADRALELLRQGIAQGYKDVDHLKRAEDFEPLRSRDDFKKLLADLEQKVKTGGQ